jgi:sugar lactone lactonase YvrE
MTSSPTTLVHGLGLLESVRCSGSTVWFSDWSAGEVHRLDLATGHHEVVARVDSLPLCFDLDGDRLVVLDSATGTLLRGRQDGPLEPWTDVAGVSRGAGNEVLTVGEHSYVLDFGNFDPREGFPTEPVGLLVRVARDGMVTAVADGLAFPNGLALTPDRRHVVVAESHAGRLTAFELLERGGLGERRTWAEVPGSAPDGIAMAADGTCWFADVPNRVVVRVAEGGEVLQRVELDRGAFSCALSPDGTVLFVAAAHWPGGERMGDPTHDWDGSLLRVNLVGLSDPAAP